MEYNTNTERYVPTKEKFTMLLEGASIQSLCEQATYTSEPVDTTIYNTASQDHGTGEWCKFCHSNPAVTTGGHCNSCLDGDNTPMECDGCNAHFPDQAQYWTIRDEQLYLCVECQPKHVNKENNTMGTTFNYNNEETGAVGTITYHFENMTIKMLEEFAKENGIVVRKSWNKARIIAAIEAAMCMHEGTGEQVLGIEDLINNKEEEEERMSYADERFAETEDHYNLVYRARDIRNNAILELIEQNKVRQECKAPSCKTYEKCFRCGSSRMEPNMTPKQRLYLLDIYKACKALESIPADILAEFVVQAKAGLQRFVAEQIIDLMIKSLPEDHYIYVMWDTQNTVQSLHSIRIELRTHCSRVQGYGRLNHDIVVHEAKRTSLGGDIDRAQSWIHEANGLCDAAREMLTRNI